MRPDETEVVRLRRRVADLESQIADMRAAFCGDAIEIPLAYGLARKPSSVLRVLVSRERVSHEGIMLAAHGHAHDGTSPSTGIIFRLRRACPWLTIRSVHGFGFCLDAAQRSAILDGNWPPVSGHTKRQET